VCKRSSTSCGTCRHFRRAIAGQLGYCGLDRRRLPLRGDELRGCWEEAPTIQLDPTAPRTAAAAAWRPPGRRVEFVPVDEPAAAERKPAGRPARPVRARQPVAPTVAVDPTRGFWAEEG